jgi:hypothetical protein
MRMKFAQVDAALLEDFLVHAASFLRLILMLKRDREDARADDAVRMASTKDLLMGLDGSTWMP